MDKFATMFYKKKLASMISEKKKITSYSQGFFDVFDVVLDFNFLDLRSCVFLGRVFHIGDRRMTVLSKKILKSAQWTSVNQHRCFFFMIFVFFL